MMNLQHLRYLLSVSRLGSFTSAAAAMHVTQPTISSGIAELESELGVQLFNRNGRQVELTIEGRTLVNYATRIQDLVDEVGDRLTSRIAAPGESFQIGSIDAAVIYLLPDILRKYLGDHPDLEMSVQVGPS